LQRCERLAAADLTLAAIRKGASEPAGAAERLALGQLCQHVKHQFAAAAHYYANVFAADPRLADDLPQQNRYNAACSAALAAAGHGEDAKNLPDKSRFELRQQALVWLQTDLAAYAAMARGKPPAREMAGSQLRHWLEDGDIASIRDAAAIEKLPDDERTRWRQHWKEVAALLKMIDEKK
jgi:eukaryotic-like serine/threonine-protein kinase